MTPSWNGPVLWVPGTGPMHKPAWENATADAVKYALEDENGVCCLRNAGTLCGLRLKQVFFSLHWPTYCGWCRHCEDRC